MPNGEYEYIIKYSNSKPDESRFNSGINDIINATRQQNFVSPYINQPEKETVPIFNSNGTSKDVLIDKPRTRQIDPITKTILSYGLAPAETFAYGLRGAGETGTETVKSYAKGDIAGGLAGTFLTPLKAGMAAVTPLSLPFALFSGGTKAASDILGNKTIETITQPTTSFINDLEKDPAKLQAFITSLPKELQEPMQSKLFREGTAGAIDLLGQIFAIKGVTKGIDLLPNKSGKVSSEIKPEKVSPNLNENTITPEGQTTSIKNRIVNQERVDRGLQPLENDIVRDWGKVGEEAMGKIKSGEVDPIKLTQDLKDNPRPITDTESAILTYDRLRIKQEHQKLLNETDTPENKQRLLQLEDELNNNDIASKQTGTELGRALGLRRMEIKDDYTLAPLLQRARIANKGEAVPENIRIKLEDYSKRIAEADAKAKEYEAQLQNLRAEKELQAKLQTKRRQGRVAKKEKLDSEYQDLIKEFASTMQLNALVDPKQVQLMTKMALNRVQKGGLSIEQVIDDIYNNTKQFIKELTKEDVRNALSDSGRFAKLSQDELKKRISEIKRAEGSDQARLQKAYKTRLENRRKEYERMLETGDFQRTPRRKTEMTPELSKLKDEVEVLKQHADREIRLIELKNRTPHEKLKDTAIDIANIPRTVMASIDLSAPLRQGVIFSAAHPKLTFGEGGSFREMFKYFQSDKAIRGLQRTIEDSPNAPLYIKSKLYLANEKTNIGRLSGREEAFLSTLPERVPILGKGIKASNRAYAGFLDKMRMDVFDFYSEQFKKSGVTFESNPKAYKDLAKFINSATGRGTLGGFERSATALSGFLFSPRLIASRLQLLNPVYYYKLDPMVRKIAMKDMVKFLGAGMTTLSLAKLAGAEVETDPRSADFGKIKVGDTRLDVWGGFQQYAVFGSRFATGQQKIGGGRIRDLDGKAFPFTTRADLVTKFVRNKYSPALGFVWDWASGKDVTGQKFDLTNKALDLITPLAMRDLYEAYQDENIDGLLLSLPTVFGVGVQTYKAKKKPVNF